MRSKSLLFLFPCGLTVIKKGMGHRLCCHNCHQIKTQLLFLITTIVGLIRISIMVNQAKLLPNSKLKAFPEAVGRQLKSPDVTHTNSIFNALHINQSGEQGKCSPTTPLPFQATRHIQLQSWFRKKIKAECQRDTERERQTKLSQTSIVRLKAFICFSPPSPGCTQEKEMMGSSSLHNPDLTSVDHVMAHTTFPLLTCRCSFC